MITRRFLALTLVLAACPPPDPPPPGGPPMDDFFPFDGERSWTYESTDTSLSFRLVSTLVGEVGESDVGRIYEVETARACAGTDPDCVDGELEHTLRWSSDGVAGVYVHGIDDADLDPPVRLTADQGWRDQTHTTDSGGRTWTSTIEGFEACPVAMSVDWDTCVRIRVEADGDGAPLAGTWWANAGFNVVAFEREGDTGTWQLSDQECIDCDGAW
jgi:hypothetical protein